MKKLLLILVSTFFVACEGILNIEIIGDGQPSDPILQRVGQFTSIDLYDSFELEIRSSDKQEVYIQAESNIVRYVNADVTDGRLFIQRLPNYDLVPRFPIKIIVTTPVLEEVNIYGNGKLLIDSLEIPALKLNIYSRAKSELQDVLIDQLQLLSNSGGSVALDGVFRDLSFRQAGSGTSTITGYSDIARIIQEGSGIITANDLYANNINVSLFGSGLIYCRGLDGFSVLINDNGLVYYTGAEPDLIDIKGSGNLVPF